MARKKEPSIRLSLKFSANPTIPVCFYCRKEKNEVDLLGKIGKGNEDVEAPRHMGLDYKPCSECAEGMAKGITLIGVTTERMDDRPEIQKGAWPTGLWAVVSEKSIPHMFKEPACSELLRSRKALVDDALLKTWLGK